MGNIYITSESETRLKNLYMNINKFYIIDVAGIVKRMKIDVGKRSGIYLLNEELSEMFDSQLNLKKNRGVIYINKNLTEELIVTLRNTFCKEDTKLVLIDNGQVPKHTDLMDLFDEVIFYERFRKNKIVECEGFVKSNSDIKNAIMDSDE